MPFQNKTINVKNKTKKYIKFALYISYIHTYSIFSAQLADALSFDQSQFKWVLPIRPTSHSSDRLPFVRPPINVRLRVRVGASFMFRGGRTNAMLMFTLPSMYLCKSKAKPSVAHAKKVRFYLPVSLDVFFQKRNLTAITIIIFNHSEKCDGPNEQNSPDTFSAEHIAKRKANGAIRTEVAQTSGAVYRKERPALSHDNGLLPRFKRRGLSKCHIPPKSEGTERVF